MKEFEKMRIQFFITPDNYKPIKIIYEGDRIIKECKPDGTIEVIEKFQVTKEEAEIIKRMLEEEKENYKLNEHE